MIDARLSRAFGKAMNEIIYNENYYELRDELLKANNINDLSNKCKSIVKKYM